MARDERYRHGTPVARNAHILSPGNSKIIPTLVDFFLTACASGNTLNRSLGSPKKHDPITHRFLGNDAASGVAIYATAGYGNG